MSSMEFSNNKCHAFNTDEAKRLKSLLESLSCENPDANTEFAILDAPDLNALLALLSFKDIHSAEEEERNIFSSLATAALRYSLQNTKTSSNLPRSHLVDFDKLRKRITLGLLPLTHLPKWIDPFISSSLKLLVESVALETRTLNESECDQNLNNDDSEKSAFLVNTTGIELLFPSYITHISPEEATTFIESLCYNFRKGDAVEGEGGSQIMLNPHAAAAVTSSLKELYSLNPSLIAEPPSLLTSLINTLLGSLHILCKKEDYESIPPLIYQLCGLTKTQPASSSVGRPSFLKRDGRSEMIMYGIKEFLDEMYSKSGKSDEVRWTICTSLAHLGRTLRSNPSLPKVLLQLVKGKNREGSVVHLCRYKRMTPMLLAMGLIMASSIPRMANTLLEALKELVVEEETLRWKRLSSKWVNCCAALFSTHEVEVDAKGKLTHMDNGEKQEIVDKVMGDLKMYQLNSRCQESHMLECMKSLVELAGRDGSDDSNAMNGSNAAAADADFSALYPTLISLGFKLIDAVKKDPANVSSYSTSAYKLSSISTCASQVTRNSPHYIHKKACSSTADLGRSLLVILFLQNATETYSGPSSVVTASPQCRSILQIASDKFCGMAPNAIEHSYLLRDLASGEHKSERNQGQSTSVGGSAECVGALVLEETFIPSIIDLLANIPAGGMSPQVASMSIIPTLKYLLTSLAKKANRNRRKRNELRDHIDHCLLLSKKVLFCTDIERRRVAAKILVMLIELGVICKGSQDSLLDEVKGYLRRCMTQHQCEVRLELYASLVSLIPVTTEEDDAATDAQIGGGVEVELRVIHSNITHVVAEILTGHLERYIPVEENETVIQARRQRGIAHGTNLSQQFDIDDNGERQNEGKSCPIRIEMCAASIRSSPQSSYHKLGRKQARKKNESNINLLTEAKDKISEPVAFLIASAAAALDAEKKFTDGTDAGKPEGVLLGLQASVADSGIEHYMEWCHKDKSRATTHDHALKVLTTCLLVASLSETLMAISSKYGNMDFHTIYKLFHLRSDAVRIGAAVIASMKAKKVKSKAVKKKNLDEEEDTPQNDCLEKEAMTIADDIMNFENHKNHQNFEKHLVAVEDAVSTLCPSLPALFISHCLKECGSLGQPKDSVDVIHSGQHEHENPETSKKSELARSKDFRRFLLKRGVAHLTGLVPVIKAGYRFDVLNSPSDMESGMTYIASSLALGPAYLSEFVSLVQKQAFTSLLDQAEIPLAQLALEGYIACLRRISSFVNGHSLDSKERMKVFLRTTLNQSFNRNSSLKEKWNSIQVPTSAPKAESEIFRLIYPFVKPASPQSATAATGGLLAELLINGLDVEAAMCCDLIRSISHNLSASARQMIALNMLESFHYPKSGVRGGIIGLDFGSDASCCKCAARAIDVSIFLDDLIDGATAISPYSELIQKPCRSQLELTTVTQADVQRVTGRSYGQSEFFELDKDTLLGTTYLLANSLITSLGTNSNFDEEESYGTRFSFGCTELLSSSEIDPNVVSKESCSTFASLVACLEHGLSDTEFLSTMYVKDVVQKQRHIILLQRMLTARLYAIGKIICASAPILDNTGSIVCALLKCCKRLFAVYTKLVPTLFEHPHSVLTQENRLFLTLVSTKLSTRVGALLLTIEEKTDIGKKQVAGSKISSQGKIASQVVFEMERCDNALLKLSAKLKLNGYIDESEFIQKSMGSGSQIRGFRIKKEEMKATLDLPDEGSGGKKRKNSGGKNTSKRKRKKNHDDDGVRVQDEDGDTSMTNSSEDSGDENATQDNAINSINSESEDSVADEDCS